MKLIITRTTDVNHAPDIHKILLDAFQPYRHLYTEGAFNATVVSAERLVKRISTGDFDVLIAVYDDIIAGTVSVKKIDENRLYVASMAVKPEFHGLGIGYKILTEVEKIATHKKCTEILLETSAPLLNAISLYEKFGFIRTGNDLDYHGIVIFEMKKTLK